MRTRGHDLGELIKDPAGVPAELHQTTWCAEETIRFMRERRGADTPWLATVNIYDPARAVQSAGGVPRAV